MGAITREIAREVSEKMEKAMRDICKEYDLTFINAKARYNSAKLTVTVEGMSLEKSSEPKDVAVADVFRGYLKAGDIGYVFDKDTGETGEWLPVVIHEAKRSKYHFHFEGAEEDGNFNVPFGGISLIDPGVPMDNPYPPKDPNHLAWQKLHDNAYRANPSSVVCYLRYIDLLHFDNSKSEKHVTQRLKQLKLIDRKGSYVVGHPHYSAVMKHISDKYL